LLAGSHKLWTRARTARTLWAGTLEDRLATNYTLRPASRSGLHGSRSHSVGRRWWRRRAFLHRRLIDGPGAGLRRDHAPLRNNRLLRRRFGWRSRSRGRRRWWHRRGRSRRGCSRRWCGNDGGRLGRRWRHWPRCNYNCRRRYRRRRLLCRRRRRRRRGRGDNLIRRFGGWRRYHYGPFWRCRLGCNERRPLCDWRRRRYGLGRNGRNRRTHGSWRRSQRPGQRSRMVLLLLTLFEQFENIARFGNLGEIDLGLDFRGAGPFPGHRRGLRRKMPAYLFGLVILKGAGVGLLFSNAYVIQHVQNGFAFHLKLSSQIIDSNLHSLYQIPPKLLRAHIDLTAFILAQVQRHNFATTNSDRKSTRLNSSHRL